MFWHARYDSNGNFFFVGTVATITVSGSSVSYNPMIGLSVYSSETNTNLTLGITLPPS